MPKPELKNIPIECLRSGKYQTRRVFAQEALQELAESIKSEGMIQPIVVRPVVGGIGEYEIIAGERRWRAAQLAGIDTVPCLVNNYSDEQTAAITPIENIQRENLNPIEEALAYQHLIDEFNYSHEEVAAVVGKSRGKITNLLRLLKLDKQVQEMLISGVLSEGHGKSIAGLSLNLQYEIAKKITENDWSTRKLEQEVRKLNSGSNQDNQSTQVDPDVRALERLITEQIGSEVKLEVDTGSAHERNEKNKKSGWLKIKYFNEEILAGILDKLGIDYD